MKNLQEPLSPAKKIEIKVVYGMLILIGLIFVLLAYWIFAPIKTLMIKQLPLPVTKPEDISSGRIIVLRFDYCKDTNLHGKVTRQLISDRSAINLPVYNETLITGCHKTDAPIILPYTVATQTFHIHYHVEYPVNPLRSEIVEFDSAKFTIIPAPSNLDQSGSLPEASDAELIPSSFILIPTPLPTQSYSKTEILMPQIQNTTNVQPTQKAQPTTQPIAGVKPTVTPTPAAKPTPIPTPSQIIQQVLQTVKDLLNLK